MENGAVVVFWSEWWRSEVEVNVWCVVREGCGEVGVGGGWVCGWRVGGWVVMRWVGELCVGVWTGVGRWWGA